SSLGLDDQGELAWRVGGGQGDQGGGSVAEPERLGHRDYQFPVLGGLEDPAACLGSEGAACRVGGAYEDVAVSLGPGRGGDGDHPVPVGYQGQGHVSGLVAADRIQRGGDARPGGGADPLDQAWPVLDRNPAEAPYQVEIRRA